MTDIRRDILKETVRIQRACAQLMLAGAHGQAQIQWLINFYRAAGRDDNKFMSNPLIQLITKDETELRDGFKPYTDLKTKQVFEFDDD